MEDSVGEMVGENCLEWCLRDSTPMGRMSGESCARRRGDVLSGAWPCPLSSGEYEEVEEEEEPPTPLLL